MKKVIIVIFTGIVVFIVVTLLMNKCTSALRESIENETKKEVSVKENKYDINAPFSEYNLNGFYEWLDYVNYIKNNFIDEKIVKCIGDLYDVDVIRYYDRWDKREYTGLSVRANIITRAQNYTLKMVLQPNKNWTDLPLTENFKNKFNEKEGVIGYYNLSEMVLTNLQDVNIYMNTKIVKLNVNDVAYLEKINERVIGNEDEAIEKAKMQFAGNILSQFPITIEKYSSVDYMFCVVFDDRGYIDNIYYLGEEYHYSDEEDAEFQPNVGYLDNIKDINECVYELCVSEEYLMKGSYDITNLNIHGSNMYYYKMDREYRNKVFSSNGILPIKDYIKDSLEVISYDENKKEAIVKIEIKDKKIYYKIKLDIDENYCLENDSVELFKEEDK